MQEIFKDIPGYEGKYQVSNMGRVKSLNYHRMHREVILKPRKDKDGYLISGLCKNGKSKTKKIHRLVLLAFIGKSDLQVNHKDGDKTNNKLENLEYCSQSENMRHAFKLGLKTMKGEHHSHNKLTGKEVSEIRELYNTGNYFERELGKIYNVSRKNISSIINRKSWAHI